MKPVLYKDQDGFTWRSLVKDTDTENDAPFGIPLGPPDVRTIDWNEMALELNKVLVSTGAFTWEDAQRNPVSLSAAISVFKRYLIHLYRQDNSQ